MRIYINNSTGNICLLNYINSNSNKFTMEYEFGFITLTINNKKSVTKHIEEEYTEIEYLS